MEEGLRRNDDIYIELDWDRQDICLELLQRVT
jgi:hypothetical protein